MKHLIQISRYISKINSRNFYCLTSAANKVTRLENVSYNLNSASTALRHDTQKSNFTIVRNFSVTQCTYSKSKDKGKDKKKKGGAAKIDETEMAELINIDKYKKDLERELDSLKNDLIKNITVRSSSGSVEELRVKMDDRTYSLQELATIVRKPKLVVINCASFPQALKCVMDALNNSGMNLNPQQEGTTIYVPTPKVTKEHRQNLSKNAKSLLVKHRDNLKDFQNKQLKTLKDQKNASQDLVRRVQDQVKALCQNYVSEAEKLVETKQKEVLGE